MKAYLLSIAGIILISAVISIVSPNGKMGKFVKGIARLAILVVMVSPLAAFVQNRNDAIFQGGVLRTDESYLAHCAELLVEKDEKEISVYLNERFSVVVEVNVFRGESNGFPRKKIEVKIIDYGIIGQGEHIDRAESVKKALEERYGCEAVVV